MAGIENMQVPEEQQQKLMQQIEQMQVRDRYVLKRAGVRRLSIAMLHAGCPQRRPGGGLPLRRAGRGSERLSRARAVRSKCGGAEKWAWERGREWMEDG